MFAELFAEVGTEPVQCTTLDLLYEEQELKADIVKIDTQGVELPTLKSGSSLLENTFRIEAETGFVEDYIWETTYAQLDEFLRSKGFTMMNLENHRVSRGNSLALYSKPQPIWCQPLWLFDVVGNQVTPKREQTLRYLKIYQTLDFFDYNYELVRYFNQIGILEVEIFQYLETLDSWIKEKSLLSRFGHHLLGWLLEGVSRRLLQKFQQLFHYGQIR
ncbi:MAG: FkbM family methyltransferase [Leptolyngbyaceae cyanobacterium bins.302]|nr:FkbM family methyltransferase [Leptolyngbyaceae cyanobacterium bins.302]